MDKINIIRHLPCPRGNHTSTPRNENDQIYLKSCIPHLYIYILCIFCSLCSDASYAKWDMILWDGSDPIKQEMPKCLENY